MARPKKVIPVTEKAIKYILTKVTTAIDLDVLYTLNNASKAIDGELTWEVVDKLEAALMERKVRPGLIISEPPERIVQAAKPEIFISRENREPTVKEILSLNKQEDPQNNPPGYVFMVCRMSNGATVFKDNEVSFTGRGETVKDAVLDVLLEAGLITEFGKKTGMKDLKDHYPNLPGLEIVLKELEK